jgi:NADH:ubiquinone oxidoreductase subunit C
MSTVETMPAQAGIEGTWTESGGIFWFNAESLAVREVAAGMKALGARFITITAHQLSGAQGFRLEYHWDLEGRLLGFRFQLVDDEIESIYGLCEAADWIEREIHEQFAIHFSGRDYEPLLLRPGNKVGVYLREEAAK